MPSLPANPEDILVYFVKLSEESESAAGVLQARSAIRHYSLLKFPSCPSPTDSPVVKMMVASIERMWRTPVTKKLPTTIFIIRKLIHRFLGQDFYSNSGKFKASITNWRVVIKTVLKFCAMARFEEAIELKRSNFNFLQSGDLEITFLKGKNYNSHDAKKTVLAKLDSEYCPVRLIKRYFGRLNYPKEVDGFFLPAVKSTTRTVPGSLRKVRDQVASMKFRSLWLIMKDFLFGYKGQT